MCGKVKPGSDCSSALLKGSTISKKFLSAFIQPAGHAYFLPYDFWSEISTQKIVVSAKIEKKNNPLEAGLSISPTRSSSLYYCINPNLVSVELFPLVCFLYGMCHPKTDTPVSVLRRCLSEDLPGREQGVLKEELGCGWRHGAALFLQKRQQCVGKVGNEGRCVTLIGREGWDMSTWCRRWMEA